MSLREIRENCVKLYADLDLLDAILGDKGKAPTIRAIVENDAVVESSVLINCLAVQHDMYPMHGPWRPFKYSKVKELDCIIVGGVPDDSSEEALRRWTGSAYSTFDSNPEFASSALHKFICYTEANSLYRAKEIQKSLMDLQKAGILLLPEILSTFVGGNKLMVNIWEPLIWNFLNEYVAMFPETPILFTTESASERFTMAVEGSKKVFHVQIEDKDECENNKTLKVIEREIRQGTKAYFNFFRVASA